MNQLSLLAGVGWLVWLVSLILVGLSFGEVLGTWRVFSGSEKESKVNIAGRLFLLLMLLGTALICIIAFPIFTYYLPSL